MVGTGRGAAVGGTFVVTATAAAVGTLLGTDGGNGTGEATIASCVGCGLGAADASGAGVGFGGAVGANAESSCKTRGWCAGRAMRARGGAITGAFGTGGAGFEMAGATRATCRFVTVTISLPAKLSGADCSDDEVASEISVSAAST